MAEEKDGEEKKPGVFKRVVGKVQKGLDWVNPLDNIADKVEKSANDDLEQGRKTRGVVKKVVSGVLDVANDVVDAAPSGPQAMIASGSGKAVGEIIDATKKSDRGTVEDLVKAGLGTEKNLTKELADYKQESASTLRSDDSTAKKAGKFIVENVTGADTTRRDNKHFSEMKKNGGSMAEFESMQKEAKKAKGGKDSYIYNADLEGYEEFAENRKKFAEQGGDPRKFTEAAKKELRDGDSLHSFNQSTDDKKERKALIQEQSQPPQQGKAGKKTASNDGPSNPQEIADKLKSGELASVEHSHQDGQTVAPPATGGPSQSTSRTV